MKTGPVQGRGVQGPLFELVSYLCDSNRASPESEEGIGQVRRPMNETALVLWWMMAQRRVDRR